VSKELLSGSYFPIIDGKVSGELVKT